jgi:hypothetical protein
MRPETLPIVVRQARKDGAVSTGARGIHAKPYTQEEKRDILERIVIAMVCGTLADPIDIRHTLQSLEWREDGLWAVKGCGLKVTAHIPQHILDAALAC